MDQLTVYPPDDNGLEETTPEQRHSAGSVVVEQLEHVHTTLRRRLHPHFTVRHVVPWVCRILGLSRQNDSLRILALLL